MRDIILLGMAREESTRIRDKMTRPFGDTSLFEIYLNKLIKISKMRNSPFSRVILALNKNDEILWSLSHNLPSPLEVIERSDWSVQEATKPSDLFHYLKDYDEEYIFRLNACFPFITPETILFGAEYFKNNPNIKSMTCVKERNNWFWDPQTNKSLTLGDPSHTTMQQSKMIYESVHCYHILNRKSLLKDILWQLKPNDPHLYVVSDSIEYIDIDTETEFQIAEAVWKVYEDLWEKK